MSLQPQAFDSTSAPGPVYLPVAGSTRPYTPRSWVIVVCSTLTVPGTSSAQPKRLWEDLGVREVESTASGLGWDIPHVIDTTRAESLEATRTAISELRRISGLTWEQLGHLFEVSRRSVHFWASGKPLSAANEQRLLRVLDVVREADRGNARATRAALFRASGGIAPFDLLVAQRFDDARALLGRGAGRREFRLTELNAAAKAARKPLPPEELVDALHDRVHRDMGRGRPARTVRKQRPERD